MADLHIPELRKDRAYWYWRAIHTRNCLRYNLLFTQLLLGT
jgi:hypothetical protein